jgi:hypothetical protein
VIFFLPMCASAIHCHQNTLSHHYHQALIRTEPMLVPHPWLYKTMSKISLFSSQERSCVVAHTCNPSYLGGGDQEDHS